MGKERTFRKDLGVFKKKGGDHEWHMIGGTIIRAHRHAAGAVGGQEKQGLGRSCGGFSSKVHAKVDSLGMALEFIITPGQASEINQAQKLIGNEKCKYLLADRGYDSDAFRKSLTKKDITTVIPGRKNRKEPIDYDKHIYKERNIVERFFGRIKEFRRIATRYEKKNKSSSNSRWQFTS
jgi:transposase